MKKLLFLSMIALAAVTPVCGVAQAQMVSIQFNPAQSTVTWNLPDALHTVGGTFALTAGKIAFDPQTGAASGLFTVDENTGQSGNSIRDGRMKKSVLKTAQYPVATFQPMHVTGAFHASGASQLAVDGVLHIYGADHKMQLNFQVTVTGNAVDAATKFDVPYVAWGMRDPSTLFFRVGKSVQMTVDAKGTLLAGK